MIVTFTDGSRQRIPIYRATGFRADEIVLESSDVDWLLFMAELGETKMLVAVLRQLRGRYPENRVPPPKVTR